MKDQVLSIEQMQVLKDLGVNTSRASMFWVKEEEGEEDSFTLNWGLLKYMIDCFETFTLQDMIELLPSKVIKDNTEFYLIIDKSTIGYIDITEEYLVHKSYNGLLNNAFNMIVWLAENKYI